MNVARALDHCAQATRAHSSTFHLGSSLFATQQRRAVRVVYAVCRSGDDAVDECATHEEGRTRLEAWWRGIERSYDGTPREDEALELGLAWALARYEIPLGAFQELYLGLEADLMGQEIGTVNDLMVYCRRVAGTVGWMVAPICGFRGGERTLLDAVALGQAMQLTNILRDVGEDLAMERCYLPSELLEKHQVDLRDLTSSRITKAYIALLEELAHIARKLYRMGWQSIPKLDGVAAVAVGLAALNYEAILDKLARNGYDNLARRAHLEPVERLVFLPLAGGRVYRGRLEESKLIRAWCPLRRLP